MVVHPGYDYLSLCAGGGGLDRAVRLVHPESRAVCYVENEVTACGVLAANMEAGTLDAAPVWSDLKTLDARRFRGRVDGIIGGYPCQPFSNAGKRLADDDPRHLWPHVARIVDAVAPRWCFFENVGAHLRLGGREVLADLQGMGYRTAAVLLTAEEVGAPHGRERLFILAHRSSARCDGGAREHDGGPSLQAARPEQRSGRLADASDGGLARSGLPVRPRGSRPPEAVAGWARAQLADTERSSGSAESREQHQARAEVLAGTGRVGDSDGGEHDGREQEPGRRSQRRAALALPSVWPPGPDDADGWRRVLAVRPDLAPATEPEVRGMADGVAGGRGYTLSRSGQLHVLGNGVVPAQAASALRMLEEALTMNNGTVAERSRTACAGTPNAKAGGES